MAEHIEQLIKTLKLDTLDSNQSLVFVKEKTKLRPSQIALGVMLIVSIILIIFQSSTLITCIGCFLIPAYFSFTCLEQTNHERDIKYLTYWVIFSVTEIVSFLFHWTVGPTIYAIVRVILTAALLHPRLQLSKKIYYGFISPYLLKHEKTIDQAAQNILDKGKQKIDQLVKKGQQQLSEQVKKNQ